MLVARPVAQAIIEELVMHARQFAPGRSLTSTLGIGLISLALVGAARAQCPEDFKLTASNGAASDQFGYSVALDGDWIAVGAAYRDGTAGADQGAVYLYR